MIPKSLVPKELLRTADQQERAKELSASFAGQGKDAEAQRAAALEKRLGKKLSRELCEQPSRREMFEQGLPPLERPTAVARPGAKPEDFNVQYQVPAATYYAHPAGTRLPVVLKTPDGAAFVPTNKEGVPVSSNGKPVIHWLEV